MSNKLIRVFVNGTWESAEDTKDGSVIVYDTGQVWEIKEELYDKFIDDLEATGFDCYLCPEMYSHPSWNGKIFYDRIIKKSSKYFEINGYWKDDKSEFSGIVKEYDDFNEEVDNEVFFFGMSEDEIIETIKAGEDTTLDFVITSYKA
jgi:hypothetical protein